jgi:hypothetical protein
LTIETLFKLPVTANTPLVRTDYSDKSAWTELCRLVEAPYEDEFRAFFTFVDDPRLEDKTVNELMDLVESGGYWSCFFVADHEALLNPEHPVMAVDLHEERGRTFRVIPAQIWAVENNLFVSNMEFSSFAVRADPDGVFRGFKD